MSQQLSGQGPGGGLIHQPPGHTPPQAGHRELELNLAQVLQHGFGLVGIGLKLAGKALADVVCLAGCGGWVIDRRLRSRSWWLVASLGGLVAAAQADGGQHQQGQPRACTAWSAARAGLSRL